MNNKCLSSADGADMNPERQTTDQDNEKLSVFLALRRNFTLKNRKQKLHFASA